jgi:arginine decarboxylase
LHGVNSDPYYLAIFLVGAYQESLGMHHNLLGSVNEAHLLVDDAGRPHIDKVIRGESLGQVLATAGYTPQDLVENLQRMAQGAEAQSKITAEERASFCDSYQSALDSYTYLED